MFKWIGNKLFKIIISAGKVILEFIKETIINAPAVTIMTFSAIGIAGTLTTLGISSALVSVSIINETVAASVLAAVSVATLATISGNIAEKRMA